MKTHMAFRPIVSAGTISMMLASCMMAPQCVAQTKSAAPTAEAGPTVSNPVAISQSALQLLQEDDVAGALDALGAVADKAPASSANPDAVASAVGGLHRSLSQLGTDEQYELLHKWSMPDAGRDSVRVLTSLVPEVAPPQEFARALGQRPKKESFAVAAVGDMPGIFCSAWSMILAADDSGNLRQLVTELEGLAARKSENSEFVLTLARIRDRRTGDDELKSVFTARVAVEGESPLNSELSDAVLVAAGMQRAALGAVCEQIVDRLNQFSFAQGTSPHVPFLRRLRATIILKNRSPETAPETVFDATPQLWIAADDQTRRGSSTGADSAIWLTHEDHIKRLAGPGDDLLLFKYPLVGTFELKGEATALDHGGAGLTYGGLAFDANSEKFSVKEVQRSHIESRVWPFVAPKELRMFNRVNIRGGSEKITFLSNLHPGWNGTAMSCSNCPWIGLRAYGDGRAYFRNLELVGEPQIPREVRLADGLDLRGWTATYGETVPKAVTPFQQDPAANTNAEPTDWHVVDGVIHGQMAPTPEADQVAQSHLAYMRPLLTGETVSYEFLHEDGKTTVHPALGRLAFLIEADGVRMHWLTDNVHEWTGLAEDNAIVEPLNRRGPGKLPLKSNAWNSIKMKLADDRISIVLNEAEIYERPVDGIRNRHIGFYHDRHTSAVQIRNVILTGEWPEKLSAEQLEKLVAIGE